MKKIFIGLVILFSSCECDFPLQPYPINPYLINPYYYNNQRPIIVQSPSVKPVILNQPETKVPDIHITDQTRYIDSIPIVITEKRQKPIPYQIVIKRDSTKKAFPIHIYIDPQTGTVVTEKQKSLQNERI